MLDDFSKKFLAPETPEDIEVIEGQKASPEAIDSYHQKRTEDFILRAGSFTEDLVAFIIEQRTKRNLTDPETVFGIALANINLRYAYTLADKDIAPEKRAEEFDEICWGAQQYWNAHAPKD